MGGRASYQRRRRRLQFYHRRRKVDEMVGANAQQLTDWLWLHLPDDVP